jgi:outer membrane protein
MKRTIFVFVVLIFYNSALYAQMPDSNITAAGGHKEYSLTELYKIALKQSETIKIVEEDLYIAERGKDKSIAAFLPVLSAFGDYTRFSKKLSSSAGFLLQPDSSTSWGLRLDQSLSLGGREFKGLEIAKETIMKSRYDLNSVKEEYLLTVASAYYDVLKSKKALEIAKTNVERLTKHRDAASVRLKVGEATKTVLLRAEAELSGAQSELIKAENNLRLAKAILARTVGIDGEYNVREKQPLIDLSRRSADIAVLTGTCNLSVLNCLRERALSERAEIRAQTIQKRITEDEVRHAEGSYWPTLSIEGEYSRTENEPSRSFEINETFSGGLSLEFPFFEGGLREAEVREAKAKQRQAELTYKDLMKTINIDVENAYLDYITQKGVLKSFKDQLAFASDNYNSVSKQFQYGLANSVDVMDANTLLVTAERELASSEYNYQLAILKLKRSTGTLLKSVISQNTKGD